MGAGCDLPPLLREPVKRPNASPRIGSGNPKRSGTHLCPALGFQGGSSWKLGFISPHLQQVQEPRSRHGLGDKEEAGLGLRTGIWGRGCRAKEQDLVPQALSDALTTSKEIPVKGGKAKPGPLLSSQVDSR